MNGTKKPKILTPNYLVSTSEHINIIILIFIIIIIQNEKNYIYITLFEERDGDQMEEKEMC
jgi:hypothetical protein